MYSKLTCWADFWEKQEFAYAQVHAFELVALMLFPFVLWAQFWFVHCLVWVDNFWIWFRQTPASRQHSLEIRLLDFRSNQIIFCFRQSSEQKLSTFVCVSAAKGFSLPLSFSLTNTFCLFISGQMTISMKELNELH